MHQPHPTLHASAPAGHRARTHIILTLVIVLLCIGAGVANTMLGDRNDHRSYSPGSLDPHGGAALAQLLTHNGVNVVHAQGAADLAQANPESTVLVVQPADLSDSDVSALKRSGATIVLLGTSFIHYEDWGFGENVWTSQLRNQHADTAPIRATARARLCTPSDLVEHDSDGSTIGPVSQVMIGAESSSQCFEAQDGAAWVQSRSYPQVFYFGAADAITNQYLAEFNNAGVAVRALGQHPTLLWVENYTADFTSDSPVTAQLPTWLSLAFAALLASGVWLAIFQARRFGKLVAEPLPVVVPAEEADTGRAHLYRAHHDVHHAARVLRSAFINRHAQRLGLSPGADPETVARAFASASHTEMHTVMSVLYTQPVHTNSDLAHLVSAVSTLEKELTRGRSSTSRS
ncbi:MAG: DUF4350 domain-containing protein [Arcanobacterium sp.]|nr:DUF4350 domain-containing protein [Arcanobacterium sp.]MDY5589307.1 DUF4350 domain-containing protein [Arcanobacterium sp.]